MNNFAKDLISGIKDETLNVIGDGNASAEVSGWYDTSSYTFNALVSGSIYNGFPSNKISIIGGDPATGKTFIALSVIKAFQDQHKDGLVIYCDSESAVTKKMMTSRGIDTSRVVGQEPETVEGFRHFILQLIDSYENTPKNDRKPLMIILDSLGNLSTNKEVEDTQDGKTTADMTRARMIKSLFRVLTIRLARANIPLIVTNHVYEKVGSFIPMKQMGGGSGGLYMASTIIFITKSKDRNSTGVVGAIIKANTHKSRFTKENQQVQLQLSYSKGLNRYYGLLDLGAKCGVFNKLPAKKWSLPDDPEEKKYSEKQIYSNPEEFFTKERLDKIDDYVKVEFTYGDYSGDHVEEVGDNENV